MLNLEFDKYLPSYFVDNYTNDPRRELAYQQEMARVEARKFSGSILDIGCGTGGFLEKFDPVKWARYGVDLSEYAVEMTRKRGIEAQTPACLEEMEPETFDVVVMRGTIQHYANPFAVMYTAHQLLKSGGMLAILATPNANGLVYKLFQDLPALDAPRNWLIPSDVMLANAVKNLGFRDTELLYPYWHGPYANPPRDFMRFFMRFFGLKKPFAFPGNMLELYTYKGS